MTSTKTTRTPYTCRDCGASHATTIGFHVKKAEGGGWRCQHCTTLAWDAAWAAKSKAERERDAIAYAESRAMYDLHDEIRDSA